MLVQRISNLGATKSMERGMNSSSSKADTVISGRLFPKMASYLINYAFIIAVLIQKDRERPDVLPQGWREHTSISSQSHTLQFWLTSMPCNFKMLGVRQVFLHIWLLAKNYELETIVKCCTRDDCAFPQDPRTILQLITVNSD